MFFTNVFSAHCLIVHDYCLELDVMVVGLFDHAVLCSIDTGRRSSPAMLLGQTQISRSLNQAMLECSR